MQLDVPLGLGRGALPIALGYGLGSSSGFGFEVVIQGEVANWVFVLSGSMP